MCGHAFLLLLFGLAVLGCEVGGVVTHGGQTAEQSALLAFIAAFGRLQLGGVVAPVRHIRTADAEPVQHHGQALVATPPFAQVGLAGLLCLTRYVQTVHAALIDLFHTGGRCLSYQLVTLLAHTRGQVVHHHLFGRYRRTHLLAVRLVELTKLTTHHHETGWLRVLHVRAGGSRGPVASFHALYVPMGGQIQLREWYVVGGAVQGMRAHPRCC